MRRKLLFGERMLWGNGTAPFNAVIPFRLQGTFVENEIQDALNQVQAKHPWLKARILYDERNFPWFDVPEVYMPIPVRVVNRHTDEDWQEESKREWNTLFDPIHQPLIRFVWLKGEEISDMLFVFHHCLCDGGSAMTLLDEFLRVLDNPSTDIGLENPIKGVADIVPYTIRNSWKQKLKAKIIGRIAATAIRLIPVGKKPVEREHDYIVHWKFDAAISKRLILYCKTHQVTVNTFLCTALLEAFQRVRRDGAFNKVSCPVDIRRFAPQIKNDHLFAFGLMIVVSANRRLSFMKRLKFMQKEVDHKTAKLNPYLTMMVLEAAHDAMQSFTRLLKNGKSSNDCMFSNLGRIQIPHAYRNFVLDTIFSPSVIGPLGNTTTLVASTFKDRLDFSFVGSEGFLPYLEALAIRDEIIQIITAQINNELV